MEFDLQGRLDNLRLPDGKTAVLYSIYEAVSNSIHAIEDRFKSKATDKGQIDVSVDLAADGQIQKITVLDNGIGLHPVNLRAFDTSDSRNKHDRGGKRHWTTDLAKIVRRDPCSERLQRT